MATKNATVNGIHYNATYHGNQAKADAVKELVETGRTEAEAGDIWAECRKAIGLPAEEPKAEKAKKAE